MTETELDEFARSLYNTRSVAPPISDNAWVSVKERTPSYYDVLVKVAEGLSEND